MSILLRQVPTILPYNLENHGINWMMENVPDDQFRIDPTKLPRQLDIDLPPAVLEQLQKDAAATGRSVDELILEILDRYLQDR